MRNMAASTSFRDAAQVKQLEKHHQRAETHRAIRLHGRMTSQLGIVLLIQSTRAEVIVYLGYLQTKACRSNQATVGSNSRLATHLWAELHWRTTTGNGCKAAPSTQQRRAWTNGYGAARREYHCEDNATAQINTSTGNDISNPNWPQGATYSSYGRKRLQCSVSALRSALDEPAVSSTVGADVKPTCRLRLRGTRVQQRVNRGQHEHPHRRRNLGSTWGSVESEEHVCTSRHAAPIGPSYRRVRVYRGTSHLDRMVSSLWIAWVTRRCRQSS
jgi:hypothetical protein